jgi:glycerophosphoryl diester phosphodiesterase|nr:glycerophosphodiester phosphodiesterase family protein [Candidatus Krumholzibacteria bacterium]
MTMICAHRGASACAPENTLAALRLAVDQGVPMSEIDVQLTADGVPVLLHDLTMERTTSGQGPLADLSLAQVCRLDAGSWFGAEFAAERVPTLEEVIGALGSRLQLNIELKGRAGPELEQAVVKLVRHHGFERRCLLTSFDQVRMDGLSASDPDLKLGYIVGSGYWRETMLEAPVAVLSLNRSLVTAERIQAAHACGKEVHVWTVDEPQEMRELRDLGVDVIISNRPDLFPRSNVQ